MIRVAQDIYDNAVEFLRTFGAFQLFFLRLLRHSPGMLFTRFGVVVNQVYNAGALSLVIIDRLPFSPPDDPVLAARIAKINREGRNAFMEYQLPEAIISLRQGAGRLIRDERDRGVLVICDPRLISKPYGRRIWQSLPPMRRTRDAEEVCDFLRNPPPDAGMTGA